MSIIVTPCKGCNKGKVLSLPGMTTSGLCFKCKLIEIKQTKEEYDDENLKAWLKKSKLRKRTSSAS